MHRTLLGTGSGLVVTSLFVTWFVAAVDPLWATENVTLLATMHWAQQAALVLGAALVAAGLVVVRLAPSPTAARDAPAAAPTDWFS